MEQDTTEILSILNNLNYVTTQNTKYIRDLIDNTFHPPTFLHFSPPQKNFNAGENFQGCPAKIKKKNFRKNYVKNKSRKIKLR